MGTNGMTSSMRWGQERAMDRLIMASTTLKPEVCPVRPPLKPATATIAEILAAKGGKA